VEKEKEKLKKMSTIASDIVSNTVQDFSVNAKFALDVERGVYSLTLEVQLCIDIVLIRSPVPLDLVEAGR
jgi:aspartate carbamoyltransferase regulatory subunit